MARLRATILGCGSSGGVPRLGGDWGDCDPANPQNRRSRCSLLVERTDGDGATRALIDTTPDLRAQLLDAGRRPARRRRLHPRRTPTTCTASTTCASWCQNRRARLPVWADAETADALISRFGYVFVQPAGSAYPPILDLNTIDGPFAVDGAGGPIPLRAVPGPARRHRGARLPHPRPRLPPGRLGDPRRGLGRARGPRHPGARRAAPQAAPDPRPPRAEPRVDRPRRAAPRRC